MRKQKQAAIEAIARHFSATWEMGKDPPDAYLMIARRRIGLEVAAIAARDGASKPRLRFDRVALGLVRRLQAALSASVPDGRTVIVTITAPIWQPGKTAEALEDVVRRCLSHRSAALSQLTGSMEIRSGVRIVKGGSRRMSKVIGFMHNPDPDIGALLDVTQCLIAGMGAKAAPAGPTDERWLVLTGKEQLSPIELYRLACSQLSLPAAFKKILMVVAGGRVETLTG